MNREKELRRMGALYTWWLELLLSKQSCDVVTHRVCLRNISLEGWEKYLAATPTALESL